MSEPTSKTRKRQRWLIGVVAVVVVALAAYWYLNRSGAPGTSGPMGRGGPGAMGALTVPVRTAMIESGAIRLVLPAVGTVTALNTVTVRSRVDGELQHIYFTDGQKVKAGDLLAQIDPRPFQVQLDQALGQQAQNLAQLRNAQNDLKRYEQLFKQNSIARQQLDAQRALVQQYQGVQVSDKAAVDSARLQLGFTRITAPISGRLGLRLVDQGNLVSSGGTEGLVVITQTQPIAVVFSLPQTQLPQVLDRFNKGDKLMVELYDSTDTRKLSQGVLASIDNQIDVATGTVKLKAQFPNEDESLFPNQFVNVRLVVSTNDQAVVVPTQAVQQGSIGTFVYKVGADNTVKVQRIVTGTTEGRRVAVLDGLQAGDQVVTEGVDRLRDGSKVQIVKE